MNDDNIYIIRVGDNFWSLESKWGIPHGTLQRLNPEINPVKLMPGQKIKIPITNHVAVAKEFSNMMYPHYIDRYRQNAMMPIDNLRVHKPLVGSISLNFQYNNSTIEEPSISNRIWGGIQMVGGAIETVIGGIGGVLTSETGVGVVIGYAVCANGIDNTVTGFNQMYSGMSEDTYLYKGVKGGSEMLGIDCNTAEKIATGAEFSTIFLGGINSIKSSKNLKFMIKNTKGTRQIGLRATNTDKHLRLERHKFKGKMDTHFNYGKGGKKHWPKRGRK